MFSKEKIFTLVKAIGSGRQVDLPEDAIIEYEIDRAIEYGAGCRNCSIEELENEDKDYTNVLVSMTLSAISLWDKLGLISTSENGVSNTFESGNIYLKKDTIQFVPLLRGI